MWKQLNCSFDIDLRKTLFSGQVFIFKEIENNMYIGNIYDRFCVLKQQNKSVLFLDTSLDIENYVKIFFNFDLQIDNLPDSKGLRFLTNDFYPTVFSFICSSNNNLKRISSMVNYLYSKGQELKIDIEYMTNRYGIDIESEYPLNVLLKTILYKFPDLQNLTSIEDELVKQKFGYRAKFICESAKILMDLQPKINWHNLEYEEAKKNLMLLKGIGRKVADCICLISLKFFQVVPLDTHIFRISKNEFEIKVNTLTDKLYEQIQKQWIEKYGKYAGIIQLYKFKESLDLQPGRKRNER